MSVSITKFTGGSWTITTLDGVYIADLDNLTLQIIDAITNEIKSEIIQLLDFFADHGGTMNIAFRYPDNPAIKRYVSNTVTSIVKN